jgi:hypothetical protein
MPRVLPKSISELEQAEKKFRKKNKDKIWVFHKSKGYLFWTLVGYRFYENQPGRIIIINDRYHIVVYNHLRYFTILM